MKKNFGFLAIALAFVVVLLPAVAGAQYVAGGTNWFDMATFVYRVLKWIGPVLVLIASLLFMYNIVKWIFSGGDKARENLQNIGYSVLGIFAMLALWALIAFISSTTGIGVGGQLSNDLIPAVETCDPVLQPGSC